MLIYKVTNKINGKIYIGQSKQSLKKRIIDHYHDCDKSNDTTYFHNALRKYNKEDFIWEIIEDDIQTQEELDAKEIYYISLYKATDRNIGYNLKSGGFGGGTNCESTKVKIGETTKQKWKNPEIAERMLNGLIKGHVTIAERKKNRIVVDHCKYCGKELIHNKYKHIYCCDDCRQIFRVKNLQAANSVNEYNRQYVDNENREKIINWFMTNKDRLHDIKLNSLSFIFKELQEITGLKDARSITRIFGFTSRKKFVTELTKIYAEH